MMKRNLLFMAAMTAAMVLNTASALPAEAPRESKAVYDEAANAVTVTATAPKNTEFDWNTWAQEPLDYISKVTIERHVVSLEWPNEAVGVLTDVKPGGEIRFVDTSVQPDQKYEYRITCYVDDEKGLPTWASVNTGVVPGRLQSFTLSTPDHETAQINVSLTAPLTSVSGNPLTSDCSIVVERMVMYTWYTMASVSDVKPGETIKFQVTEDVEMDANYSLRAYAKIGENGSGDAIEAKIYVGEDTPAAPENLSWKVSGNDVILDWDQPVKGANGGALNPDNVKYNVYFKSINDSDFVLIEEKYEGCHYALPLELQEEEVMEFAVSAVNGKGESYYMAQTPEISAGPYAVCPFRESFAGNMYGHRGWTHSTNYDNEYSDEKCTFTLGSVTEYYSIEDKDIVILPQDDDGGLLTNKFPSYGPQGQTESLTSPRISFTDIVKPAVSFWYYYIPTPDFFLPNEVRVSISVEDGEFEEVFFSGNLEPETSHGWRYVNIPADKFAGKEFGRVRFDAIRSTALYNVTLDNIMVYDDEQSEIAVPGVGLDENSAPVEYFNLQGRRVSTPESGIFIRRQGAKVTKITIR